jgi:hypothetical protein
MNAVRYLKMLWDRVWLIISEWEIITTLNFMQVGATPSFQYRVHAWLHDHFPGLWTERRVHEDLLAPHMLLWLRLWGLSKEWVCRTKPRNLEELEEKTTSVLTNIPWKMWSAITKMPVQIRKCADSAGVRAEMLCVAHKTLLNNP